MASTRGKRVSAVQPICAILLYLLAVSSWSPSALAQTASGGVIRVESNEVFVPVLVVDKKRVAEFQHMNREAYWKQVVAGDWHSIERLAVPGLSAKDFRLWEDGQQESVSGVAAQGQSDSPIIFDNLSGYRELLGPGGGTWAIPLLETVNQNEGPDLAGYDIAFIPAPSPDGSCHEVNVAVDRPDSLVLARTEYCNARRSAADPLKGTTLGSQLRADIQSNRPGKISIAATAIPLFTPGGTRVRIVVDYASQPEFESCTSKPAAIGILGVAYSDNGTRPISFSDEISRMYGDDLLGWRFWTRLAARKTNTPCPFRAPFRYETQVEIPPGNYRLQIGFRDGKKFGRADLEVTVPRQEGTGLSISGIALARRFRDIPMRPANSPTLLPQNYAPLVSEGVELTPTANTGFQKNSPFCFFFQIYEPLLLKQPQPKVEAQLRIVDANTGKVATQIKPINATPYAESGNPIIAIGRRIDISFLPIGSYRLEVQATDSAGESTPWRTADFTIEKWSPMWPTGR